MGELREVVAAEWHRRECGCANGYDPSHEQFADWILAAIREHLSAHPGALGELVPALVSVVHVGPGGSEAEDVYIVRQESGVWELTEDRAPAPPVQKEDGE